MSATQGSERDEALRLAETVTTLQALWNVRYSEATLILARALLAAEQEREVAIEALRGSQTALAAEHSRAQDAEQENAALREALERILGQYHQRHLLLARERAMLPFEMKEIALAALAQPDREQADA